MEEVTMENNEEVVETPTEEVKNPEAVLAELRRAQEDLKNLRADLKALTTERNNLKAAVEEAQKNPFKDKALEAETKLALQGLGLNDPDRLIRYIGKDGIDFDENGGLKGLNERIEQLKADLPELFDVKRRVGGKADIFADNSGEVKKSSTELQVERIFNRV